MVTLKMGTLHRLFVERQSMLDAVRQANQCPEVGSVTFKFDDISVPETAMRMGKSGSKKWCLGVSVQIRPRCYYSICWHFFRMPKMD